MNIVECRLLAHSNSPHLAQIYTGFVLLKRMGKIGLSQEIHTDINGARVSTRDHAHLSVIVNRDIKVHYDTADGNGINESSLKGSDLYFKRSYLPAAIPEWARDKVFPLGLHYAVHSSGMDSYEILRILRLETPAEKVKTLSRLAAAQVGVDGGQWLRPTVNNIRKEPDYSQKPRILFLAAAWEPSNHKGADKLKNEEREHITRTRAQCIETLRREFGTLFLGGFPHTDYARKYFRGALLDDPSFFRKGTYVSLMKQHPVCVATTGLHGSIGWKLAEYVACSRAILTERMNYVVPGGFEIEKNFLEFDGPESCAENAARLMADHELRCRLMRNNNSYYEESLEPAKLVSRTLDIALKRSGAKQNMSSVTVFNKVSKLPEVSSSPTESQA